MKFVEFAFLVFSTLAVTADSLPVAGQNAQWDLGAVLTRSCLLTDSHLGDLARGDIVVSARKTEDKKEISMCGIVRLDRIEPTITELRDGFSQKGNRSILAAGVFSEPPTKRDLHDLRLEKKDLDALLRCKPRNCGLLVSDTLLQTLTGRNDWQHGDLEDLYAEDLAEFARNFRKNGMESLKFFDGSSVSIPLAEQHRELIDRVPLLSLRVPALSLYVKDFPPHPLAGTETTLSWSKVTFGLKPIVTITSTTSYSPMPSEGEPIIVTHQIYASRYMNGSVAIATCLSDDEGHSYLIFANISRSDTMGGLFSGIKRSIVVSEGTERIKDLLRSAKVRLEMPSALRDDTPPASSNSDSQDLPLSGWISTEMMVIAVTILILLIYGTRFYRRSHR